MNTFMNSPFEQFQVSFYCLQSPYASFFSTTAISSFFTMFFSFCLLLFIYKKEYLTYRSNLINRIFQEAFIFVHDTVDNNLGKKGFAFFQIILFLFLFISFSNLVGLIPYGFTITSQLSVTLCLSFIVWYGVLLSALSEVGRNFFTMFIPSGVNLSLGSFICVIESLSFVFRLISLALRLFANLVAGHILLETVALLLYKICISLSQNLVTFTSIGLCALPTIMIIILFFFETIVAIVQAYVFILLWSIYLQDVLHFSAH